MTDTMIVLTPEELDEARALVTEHATADARAMAILAMAIKRTIGPPERRHGYYVVHTAGLRILVRWSSPSPEEHGKRWFLLPDLDPLIDAVVAARVYNDRSIVFDGWMPGKDMRQCTRHAARMGASLAVTTDAMRLMCDLPAWLKEKSRPVVPPPVDP